MDKSVLKWNFIFQYGWVLTNVINSLLLLPFYIKYIDVTTLGVWLASSGILNWITMVDPGIGEVLQQKIAEFWGKKEHLEIGRSIGSGIISSSFIVFIAFLVGVVFYFCLGFFIHKDVSMYRNLSGALFITICATGLSLVSFTFTGINQGLQNTVQVAISSLTANVLFLLVNLLFLYLDFGLMAIAIANLSRSLYMNIYNFSSMKRLLQRESIQIVFSRIHFKSFIRIFSFTSASRIISGLSNSLDMIVLARYIAPAMITVYEINRRPLGFAFTLIGRHSVAMMPVISHAKGKEDTNTITNLINNQFGLYMYAAFFTAFMFALNFYNLITLWVGPGKYIGNTIVYLMVIYNVIALICYFMANMGYALGDIKNNSMFNIIRNVFFGIFIVIAARYYGIVGTVAVSLIMSLSLDLFFFSFRVYKLGYLQISMLKKLGRVSVFIITASLCACWLLNLFIINNIPANMFFIRLMVGGGAFSIFYILLLLTIDPKLRNQTKALRNKLFLKNEVI